MDWQEVVTKALQKRLPLKSKTPSWKRK